MASVTVALNNHNKLINSNPNNLFIFHFRKISAKNGYSSPRIQIKHRIKLAYIKLAFITVFDEIKNDNPNITLNFSWT